MAPDSETPTETVDSGHGPAYDSTHIYTTIDQHDLLAEQLLGVFGGELQTYGSLSISPQPSESVVSVVLTPHGLVSIFGFSTPVPHPFGDDTHGYRVRNREEMHARIDKAGLDVAVKAFDDLGGAQVIVRLPGGKALQLYEPPAEMGFPELEHIPEARFHLGRRTIDPFVTALATLTGGSVVEDVPDADGTEVGRPGHTLRRVRFESGYGQVLILETDGHHPFPHGWDFTGFAVEDLPGKLAAASDVGAEVLWGPEFANGRTSALVQFTGGFVAELHASS